jgi:hypothetical protein
VVDRTSQSVDSIRRGFSQALRRARRENERRRRKQMADKQPIGDADPARPRSTEQVQREATEALRREERAEPRQRDRPGVTTDTEERVSGEATEALEREQQSDGPQPQRDRQGTGTERDTRVSREATESLQEERRRERPRPQQSDRQQQVGGDQLSRVADTLRGGFTAGEGAPDTRDRGGSTSGAGGLPSAVRVAERRVTGTVDSLLADGEQQADPGPGGLRGAVRDAERRVTTGADSLLAGREQGLETGSGPVAQQARELEQRAIEQNPELRPKDVAVERSGDQLQASLTESGRDYTEALARLEQDNRTAGDRPQDFGDRFVPASVEDPADDFARFVERGVSGGLEGTPGVQSTMIVPTGGGLAAPGIGGEPNQIEQGVAEGTGDFVAGAAALPSTGIQVAEAGTYAVGGTGLAGGSREETAERTGKLAGRGAEIAGRTASFAQENPVRFATGVGLGAVTGSAASRVAGGSRTGLVSSTRRTAGTYRSALPDVDTPSIDIDLTRTLRGDDRGMADFGSRSDQDLDTQEEAELTVERGTEEAAEAEGSVEEFMEREPANAAFRQENINEGRGPSTPLAVERGLDDLTADDFGMPSNVERTLLDRESGNLRDRLPDPEEFESREAFESELEMLRERAATESGQQQTLDTETDQAGATGRTATAVEGSSFAAADAGAVVAATAYDTRDDGLEAETFAERSADTGLAVTPAIGQQQDTAADQQVDLGLGIDTTTDLTQDQTVDLGQQQTTTRTQERTTEVTQEQTTGVTTDLTTDVTLTTDQTTTTDQRQRLDLDTDTRRFRFEREAESKKRGGKGDGGLGFFSQREEFDTVSAGEFLGVEFGGDGGTEPAPPFLGGGSGRSGGGGTNIGNIFD